RARDRVTLPGQMSFYVEPHVRSPCHPAALSLKAHADGPRIWAVSWLFLLLAAVAPHLVASVYRALAGLDRAGHPAHCREPCSRVLVPDEHRRIGGGEQHRLGWLLKSWHR